MCVIVWWVFVGVVTYSHADGRKRCFGVLTPDEEIFDELLHDKEQCLYKLQDIIPGSSYELKISYRATIPTDFLIDVRHSNVSSGRRLLNIEKTQFSVASGKYYEAMVVAHRTGVSVYPEALKDPAVFNIVLSTLYYGLPWEVWKLVGLILLSIVASVFWLNPWLLNFIERSTAHLKKDEQSHVE
ncbi:uncharacterized protein LOC134192894 [Corticium candelabrum]|uniref:uncharacterized protein LOC134192894 n=1 Tax=Corticium candelabrum TaxID=121492 RepID=UPI002E2531CB|nr:uncharacterized protein LOC134192894 [Corticium candelabrum]